MYRRKQTNNIRSLQFADIVKVLVCIPAVCVIAIFRTQNAPVFIVVVAANSRQVRNTLFAIPAHERQDIMSGAKKEKIQHIKQETMSAKSALIRQYERMREISIPQAERLGRIIARLEAWQHK